MSDYGENILPSYYSWVLTNAVVQNQNAAFSTDGQAIFEYINTFKMPSSIYVTNGGSSELVFFSIEYRVKDNSAIFTHTIELSTAGVSLPLEMQTGEVDAVLFTISAPNGGNVGPVTVQLEDTTDYETQEKLDALQQVSTFTNKCIGLFGGPFLDVAPRCETSVLAMHVTPTVSNHFYCQVKANVDVSVKHTGGNTLDESNPVEVLASLYYGGVLLDTCIATIDNSSASNGTNQRCMPSALQLNYTTSNMMSLLDDSIESYWQTKQTMAFDVVVYATDDIQVICDNTYITCSGTITCNDMFCNTLLPTNGLVQADRFKSVGFKYFNNAVDKAFICVPTPVYNGTVLYSIAVNNEDNTSDYIRYNKALSYEQADLGVPYTEGRPAAVCPVTLINYPDNMFCTEYKYVQSAPSVETSDYLLCFYLSDFGSKDGLDTEVGTLKCRIFADPSSERVIATDVSDFRVVQQGLHTWCDRELDNSDESSLFDAVRPDHILGVTVVYTTVGSRIINNVSYDISSMHIASYPNPNSTNTYSANAEYNKNDWYFTTITHGNFSETVSPYVISLGTVTTPRLWSYRPLDRTVLYLGATIRVNNNANYALLLAAYKHPSSDSDNSIIKYIKAVSPENVYNADIKHTGADWVITEHEEDDARYTGHITMNDLSNLCGYSLYPRMFYFTGSSVTNAYFIGSPGDIETLAASKQQLALYCEGNGNSPRSYTYRRCLVQFMLNADVYSLNKRYVTPLQNKNRQNQHTYYRAFIMPPIYSPVAYGASSTRIRSFVMDTLPSGENFMVSITYPSIAISIGLIPKVISDGFAFNTLNSSRTEHFSNIDNTQYFNVGSYGYTGTGDVYTREGIYRQYYLFGGEPLAPLSTYWVYDKPEDVTTHYESLNPDINCIRKTIFDDSLTPIVNGMYPPYYPNNAARHNQHAITYGEPEVQKTIEVLSYRHFAALKDPIPYAGWLTF